MNSGDFYHSDDHPTRNQQRKMWRSIENATPPQGSFVFAITDRRSFLFGMAAAIFLFFSGVGVYSLADRAVQSAQPAELRFDEAYRMAIQEFESVLPTITKNEPAGAGNNLNLIKRQQLALIDAAIKELREDIARTDLSPLKRSRLRQLYSMKLNVLQEIIAQGDIEL